MTEQISCPYCNTLMPRQAILEGLRVHCPRCGESFPNPWGTVSSRFNGSGGETSEVSKTSEVLPVDSTATARGRWPNRWLGAALIGMMGIMAVVGLSMALWTWGIRQSRHPKAPTGGYGPESYAPAELPALGYLPADSNVVAGIHLAELLKDAVSAKLMESPLPGPLEWGLAAVENQTGLKRQAIDHVVLATSLYGDMPQLTLVVRTRLPYTLEDVGRRFTGKPLPHHKKPLFRFKLEPAGGGYLWCADPRTLVMILRLDGTKIEDMDRIPATPRQGAEGLPKPLQQVLKQRLRGSVLWLAGHWDRAEPIEALAAFSRLPPQHIHLLGQIKTFAVGILVQEDLTLVGACECRDRRDTWKLQNILEKLTLPGIKSKKIFAPPMPAAFSVNAVGTSCLTPGLMAATSLRLMEAANQSGKSEAHWVTWQIRAAPAGMRGVLDKDLLLKSNSVAR